MKLPDSFTRPPQVFLAGFGTFEVVYLPEERLVTTVVGDVLSHSKGQPETRRCETAAGALPGERASSLETGIHTRPSRDGELESPVDRDSG